VTHPDSQAFTYGYDARDRLTGVYEGIGTGTALDGIIYNPDDTLASRLEGAGGGGSANYSYDPIGRLTGQTDAFPAAPASNVQWNFQINQASQILSETRDNDAYAFTAIASANKAYAVNGLNQYTAVAGTGHTYDANGNLTGDGTNAYIYDGENRLVSATAAGVTTTLTYDPMGRLWQVVKGAANTRFLYDGDALVGEFDSGGVLTNRYVHGSNLAADDPLLWYVGSGLATKRYLHADHLGSVVAATNAASAPTINAYDEYGVPRSGNVGRFQYTGQIWLSELGLYHYKARLYSPMLGRFLQTDPVGYQGGLNLYAYVSDDPANTADFGGTCPVQTCKGGDMPEIEGGSPNPEHAYFQQPGFNKSNQSAGGSPITQISADKSSTDERKSDAKPGTPSRLVVVGSTPNNDYQTFFYYQATDVNGVPLTQHGYSLREQIYPRGETRMGTTSNNEFKSMNWGSCQCLARDTIGIQNPPPAGLNQVIVRDQTFTIRNAHGNYYNVTTIFSHRTEIVNGKVIVNDTTTVRP
jgi:RHS repeat-associated protein